MRGGKEDTILFQLALFYELYFWGECYIFIPFFFNLAFLKLTVSKLHYYD